MNVFLRKTTPLSMHEHEIKNQIREIVATTHRVDLSEVYIQTLSLLNLEQLTKEGARLLLEYVVEIAEEQ